MNRLTQFVYEEWRWILLYLMLGIVMYWTAIVIQPTTDIQQTQKQEITQGLVQQEEIIANQDNNTQLLVELFERQNKLLSNQIVLVTKLTNATQTLNQSNTDINQHIETIVSQSNNITQMVQFFRDNFGTDYLRNETIERSTSTEILGNVTRIGDAIRELIVEIRELKGIAGNATR